MKNSPGWGYDATPYIWKPIIKMGGPQVSHETFGKHEDKIRQNYMISKDHLIEEDLMIKDMIPY